MSEDEMVGWHHRLDGQEFAARPSVFGVLQARILEWVTMPSSRESS